MHAACTIQEYNYIGMHTLKTLEKMWQSHVELVILYCGCTHTYEQDIRHTVCSAFGHFTAWCMQLLYSDCCSVCDVIMHGSCSRGHVFDRLPRVVLLDSPF